MTLTLARYSIMTTNPETMTLALFMKLNAIIITIRILAS